MAAELDPALLAAVRREVARLGHLPDLAGLAAVVRASGLVLGGEDLRVLAEVVASQVLGAGPLQRLLDDPEVTDVLVTPPGQVWVDRGNGVERADVDLGGPERVRALAVRLAAAGGQRLDDAAPVVDARLPDGTRLHAVLPPVAPDGTLLSLRTLRRRAFGLDELVSAGTVAPELAGLLRTLIRSRANLLVSGQTGAGKTTIVSTLLGLVPPDERIVCIEEAPELGPEHPHVVRLAARRANVEGIGEVDLATLVRQALRMRPDRIVLGECRGAEVREVLTAMNTGHDGGCATLHANAVEDVPARLVALGALAGMPADAVRAQAASGLDVVLHVRRAGGHRYLAQVGDVRTGHDGDLRVERVLEVDRHGTVRRSPGWPVFAQRWGLVPAGRDAP